MYKYLVAIFIALSSLVAFAHDHGDKGSEKKAAEKAEKKAAEKAEKKATEPKKIQYEDPKKYYPKK